MQRPKTTCFGRIALASCVLWISVGSATGARGGLSEDDGAAFLAVLDSLWSSLGGIACEYEGQEVYLDQQIAKNANLEADGVYDSFSGSLRWRGDGFSRLEIYRAVGPKKELAREILVVRGEESEIYTNPGDPKAGAGYVQDSRRQNLSRPASVGLIFQVDALRGLLKNPHISFKHEGVEKVDGHECQVVAFYFPDKKWPHQRFWIDVNRGGHSLKRELYGDEGRLATRTSVRLRKFQCATGGADPGVWLPASGDHEVYPSAETASRTTADPRSPWSATHLDVIPTTVECKVRFPDSVFVINYRPGTPVSDALRGVMQEYGQQLAGKKRITRREAESLLEEQLKATADQREDLMNHSSYDDTSSALPWIFLVCGVSSLVAGVVLIYLRRS